MKFFYFLNNNNNNNNVHIWIHVETKKTHPVGRFNFKIAS